MRSCALRIFDAETISMALVIFFVFSKLLILARISLPAAMSSSARSRERLLERGDGAGELVFRGLVHRLVVLELGEQRGVARLQVLVQAMLERQRLLDVDVIEEALVHRKD